MGGGGKGRKKKMREGGLGIENFEMCVLTFDIICDILRHFTTANHTYILSLFASKTSTICICLFHARNIIELLVQKRV